MTHIQSNPEPTIHCGSLPEALPSPCVLTMCGAMALPAYCRLVMSVRLLRRCVVVEIVVTPEERVTTRPRPALGLVPTNT